MESVTGPFEGFDAYDDKWFPSAMKCFWLYKKVICLLWVYYMYNLYNCVKCQQCISIYEEDINNSQK